MTINWKEIINELKTQQGEIRTIGLDFYKNIDGRFNEIITLWNDAGYTSNKVEWINFYPGTHFNENISSQFAKLVGIKHIRSWISCTRPGKSAPWHRDVDDAMDDYLKMGQLERYTCHIGEPAVGQVMLVDQESFYMIPEGTITRWPDALAWHGAANCGFDNHYLYHFLGYK